MSAASVLSTKRDRRRKRRYGWRHTSHRHSRDWCRLIAVVLHEAAIPVSASTCHSVAAPLV